MEEAKDIRELKSLLSGLSLQEGGTPSPRREEVVGADTGERKIALLKSASVFLFALSLFLVLCLVSLLLRTYVFPTAYPGNNKRQADHHATGEVPAAVIPAPAPPEQRAATSSMQTAVPAEPAPSAEAPVRTAVLREQGGSLYFIALKNYGRADETLFDLILQANPAIVDVRKIEDLHRIILPDITAESYVQKIPGGRYRVYIGTFDTADWAKVYASRVKHKEKSIFIESFTASSRETWYRVTMGDFAEREEAHRTVTSLAHRGLIYIPPQLR